MKTHVLVLISCDLANVVTSVRFSNSGDLLATGNRGGQIVIYEGERQVRSLRHCVLVGLARICTFQKSGVEYRPYTEFQSHEPEFDYLKSLEIEEKINEIRWCKPINAGQFLLATNGMPTI